MRLKSILSVLSCLAALRLFAADCNQNGVDDSLDVAPSRFGFRVAGKIHIEGGLEIADMNGDGAPDLVVLDGEPPRIDVLRNEKGWKFAELSSAPLSSQAQDFALGDLDRDGDVDVAVAYLHGVEVHLNRGDGQLEARPVMAVGSGVLRVFLEDFNADGFLDLVTVNQLDNVSVFLNLADGTGGFQPPRNYFSGERVVDGVAADADGDGDVDLILVENSPPVIIVLKNDGRGNYFERVVSAEERFHLARGIGAGDFDGDSDVDLVLTHTPSERVTLLFNLGQGIFDSPTILGGDHGEGAPLVQDLNGDSRPDVTIAQEKCSRVRVLLNQGWGPDGIIFPESVLVEAGGSPPRFIRSLFAARASDLDGDGDTDLAAFGSEGIALLANEPVGSSADCDRDGIPDECERDCNSSRLPDACDIEIGASTDCDQNGIPDECDPDCDGNESPDACDIASGAARDCNRNGIPDACDGPDANGNGVPDDCDLGDLTSLDCNENGVPDEADLEPIIALVNRATPIAPEQPSAVLSGDFDGDGSADLIVSSFAGSGTQLIRKSGGPSGFPTLRPQQIMEEGSRSCDAADFDGDGDLDLACCAEGAGCWVEKTLIVVLENLGKGAFRRSSTYLFSRNLVCFLRAGDVDGDGSMDLIVLSVESLWVLRGRRDGTFEMPRGLAARPPDVDGSDFTLVDIDGDGDPDVALAAGKSFLNDGGGRFVPGPAFPAGGRGGIAAGDFDGDGDVDLATAGVLALNDGNGAFHLGTVLPRYTYGGDLLAADLDGDRKMDLALAGDETLFVLLNRGGSFAKATSLIPGFLGEPRLLAAGDFNGDELVDLAVVNSGLLTFCPNQGGGQFQGRLALEPDREVFALQAADLDLDGDKDLVLLAPLVLQNLGKGEFRAGSPLPVEGAFSALRASDLDGDGDPDLLLGENEKVVVLANERAAGFSLRREILLPGMRPDAIFSRDLDGDRDLDVIASDSNSGEIRAALQTGGRDFEVRQVSKRVEPARALLLSDLDGDGDEDLLAGTQSALFILANDGGGSFAPMASFDPGGSSDSAVSADWDGDGSEDLAVSVNSRIAIFRNDGKGGFTRTSEFLVPTSSRELVAADLDLDGDLDLVAPHTVTVGGDAVSYGNEVELFINRGHGTLESWGSLAVGPEPGPVVAEDLDGDGYPDLAIGLQGGPFEGQGGTGVTVLTMRVIPPRGEDRDKDGLIDECESKPFRRGDWNQDGALNISDAVALLDYLFRGGRAAPCLKAGDTDGNGHLGVTDPVRILLYLFAGGAPPKEPFAACGTDPASGRLPCASFEGCG